MKINKEDKKKIKERNVIEKFIRRKDNNKSKYITKHTLKEKVKNSEYFVNSKSVDKNGTLKLRDGSYAKIYSVNAIDLSLTSNIQKQNFFQQLKFLYQLKDLNMRIYKLDDRINLNANKDYYSKLIEEYKECEINEEDK